MANCVAIVSVSGTPHFPSFLPSEYKKEVEKHAKDFLYALKIEDEETQLPYIETSTNRYIYKQTDDLYWLMVTRPESDMFADMNLLGKFVCTIMEYGCSETNSRTLTHEQRDLFYRHLWRPWDEDYRCTICGCTCQQRIQIELEGRLNFLNSIRDGHVDEDDINYFNRLITECWNIISKLSTKKNSDSESSSFTSFTDSSDVSLDEVTLIDNIRLKCSLEDMRLTLSRLADPYLRLFAKRDLLIGLEEAVLKSSAPSFKELDHESMSESD